MKDRPLERVLLIIIITSSLLAVMVYANGCSNTNTSEFPGSSMPKEVNWDTVNQSLDDPEGVVARWIKYQFDEELPEAWNLYSDRVKAFFPYADFSNKFRSSFNKKYPGELYISKVSIKTRYIKGDSAKVKFYVEEVVTSRKQPTVSGFGNDDGISLVKSGQQWRIDDNETITF